MAVCDIQDGIQGCAPDLSCLKGRSSEDFHALQVLSQQISLTAFWFYCPARWICAGPSPAPLPPSPAALTAYPRQDEAAVNYTGSVN